MDSEWVGGGIGIGVGVRRGEGMEVRRKWGLGNGGMNLGIRYRGHCGDEADLFVYIDSIYCELE